VVGDWWGRGEGECWGVGSGRGLMREERGEKDGAWRGSGRVGLVGEMEGFAR
jgi:hypothetical protein